MRQAHGKRRDLAGDGMEKTFFFHPITSQISSFPMSLPHTKCFLIGFLLKWKVHYAENIFIDIH
jgi:hypothetical protein